MRWLAALALALAVGAEAADAPVEMLPVDVDLHDKASLQRGLGLYLNYCMGCHSLGHARYQRSIDDLGVPAELAGGLVHGERKLGDLMRSSMSRADGEKWFGVAPPDLTLLTRLRSPQWLNTYLLSFYADPSRPWGVNNRLFVDTAMPHALYELQGLNRCALGPSLAPNGGVRRDPLSGEDILSTPCGRFESVEAGRLDADGYATAVRDIVNFMHYVAEPAALIRRRMGVYVLLFLAIFGIFAWLLKREYWRDIH